MSENVIGKFCTLGKKNTIVYPKSIPGYTSPEPQVLTEDKQQIRFVYAPIQYKVSYDLDGGHFYNSSYKDAFTVEDPKYIPPNPVKKDNNFAGWNFARLKSGENIDSVYGVGDVVAKATWIDNAILVPGDVLNKYLEVIAGDVNNIMAIQQSPTLIENDYINISCTKTPILARFDSGIIYIYCDSDIYCNENMKGAFKNLTILRDVSALYNFICNKGTDISEMFSGCALLSDLTPVEEWADGQFSNFDDAFKGTAALSAGRVPEWYRWNVVVHHMSSSGRILGSSKETHIPGETIYHKSFNGYKPFIRSIEIDSPDKEYTFIYDAIPYKISYIVDGKETSVIEAPIFYTIENVGYYPPELFKEGYTFSGWYPECIKAGEYGDATFVANFIKI